MDILTYFVVGALWILLLPFSLLYVSNNISFVGVYHTLKHGDNHGEPLIKKISCLAKCNFQLAYPFAFAFYLVVTQSVKDVDLKLAVYLSLVFALVTLGTLRLLSNPSELVRPGVCRLHPDRTEKKKAMELHKERFISFFFAFISGALIILLIVVSYNIILSSDLVFPHFNAWDFGFVFVIYNIMILITAIVTELILGYISKPYDPMAYRKKGTLPEKPTITDYLKYIRQEHE